MDSLSSVSTSNSAPGDLRRVAEALQQRPFVPHRRWRGGHAQTVLASLWPRRARPRPEVPDEGRIVEVETGVRVRVDCRWQPGPRAASPALLLVHGLEGSSESAYILSTAHKAWRAGFHVLRFNIRTCGGTERLTPTLYHSGMSGDLLRVIEHFTTHDGLTDVFLGGFSLGGNMALKLAGEGGDELPPELKAVCAVSPSLDLAACAAAIERRDNWLYQRRFLTSLRRRLRHAHALYPERYDPRHLRRVRSIRDFDAHYTAPAGGFRDADDYYARASALPLASRIRRPTLIIHAQDDPFIPYASFLDAALNANPCIVLLAPAHGGHVGFVADRPAGDDPDRFWAENRLIEFCRLLHQQQR